MTASSMRILVVDDERAIRRFLRVSLGSQYTVIEAADGRQALQAVASERPDLVILDLGLPDMDGAEVTRRLREWTQIPIIIVSVREREEDKIAALDAGADDYLTKPFGIGELMARIRVAVRRSATPENEPVFQVGELVVDLAHRSVDGARPGSDPDSHRIRHLAHPDPARRLCPDAPAAAAYRVGCRV